MSSIGLMTTVVGALVVAFVVSGCPSSMSGGAYGRSQARQIQQVEMGTVVEVRPVQIEGTSGAVGTASGAAIGGLAGSTIGGGTGQKIAAIGGAVLGGLVGAAAEEGFTRKQGLEITVRLDSGRTIAITQEADEAFFSGDRVRLVTSPDGTARVAR